MRFLVIAAICSFTATATAWAEEEKKEAAPKNYDVVVKANPDPVKSGAATSYTLTITPKGEYVLKNETPFKLALVGSDGVKLDKDKFTAKDFKDPKATAKSVETKFSADAGARSIDADLTFFLCTEEICQRFKDKVKLEMAVK